MTNDLTGSPPAPPSLGASIALADAWQHARPAAPASDDADGLSGVARVDLCIGPAMPATLHVVQFASERFSPTAFRTLGIARPLSIATSVNKRQAEFCFGRMAARLALSEYGLGDVQVGIGHQREPLWPHSVCGSITHNHQFAAAIALPRHHAFGIGIDIETHIPAHWQDSLLSTVISREELDYLREFAAPADLPALCSIVFSAKESFYKAAFQEVGHFFDFDAVKVTRICPDDHTLTFEVRQCLSPRLVPGLSVTVFIFRLDAETFLTVCRI